MQTRLIFQFAPEKIDIKQRADLIESTKWLREWEWSQIESLARYMEVYELPANTIICKEGSTEGFLALIESGTVKVLKTASDDSQKLVCTLGIGKAFGEVSLIDGFPRSAAVVSDTSVKLLVLTQANYALMTTSHPVLATQLLTKLCKLLSARLRHTSGKLAEFLE